MFRGLARRRASNARLDREELGKENGLAGAPTTSKPAAKRASVFQDNNRKKTTRLDSDAKQGQQPGNDGGSVEMSQAFDQLLVSSGLSCMNRSELISFQDDLQIPDTLRPKLTGMDSTVKAAMLRSSRVIKPGTNAEHETPKEAPGTLRKTKSSDSVGSPRPVRNEEDDLPHPPQTTGRFLGAAMRSSISLGRHSDDEQLVPPKPLNRHSRGLSLDLSKGASMLHLPSSSSSEIVSKKAPKGWSKDIAPSKHVNALTSTSSVGLDIETVKKLRLLLRNESAR